MLHEPQHPNVLLLGKLVAKLNAASRTFIGIEALPFDDAWDGDLFAARKMELKNDGRADGVLPKIVRRYKYAADVTIEIDVEVRSAPRREANVERQGREL